MSNGARTGPARPWRDWMTARRTIMLCAALLVLCLALGSLPDAAYAASGGGTGEGLTARKGLATGNPNEGKGTPPTRTQMAIGFGSFIVMIIVVKWL